MDGLVAQVGVKAGRNTSFRSPGLIHLGSPILGKSLSVQLINKNTTVVILRCGYENVFYYILEYIFC